MHLGLLIAGIVLLIIGIILIPVGYFTAFSVVYGGIALLIIGIILSGIGAALKPKAKIEAPATPAALISMVESLASAEENVRRTMIRERLNSFASMSDNERASSMKMMMDALGRLNIEQLKRITYTRLESLAEDFDEVTREKLITTHMNLLLQVSLDYRKKDIQAMVLAMMECHPECRMKVMGTMKKVLAKLTKEQREAIMQEIPEEARKMMM